jgi:hypothetical protein
MWQSMSAINTSFAFDSKCNDKVDISTRPKWKPKAASSSAKDCKTDVHPDLERSLNSFDRLSLGRTKGDDTKNMWNSTSMIEECFVHPNDELGQGKGVRATWIYNDLSMHKFRAHNRPNDWLGSEAKPSRRSWSAKRIVKSSELLEDDKSDETKTTTPNTETESET